jgi:putative membrane protein
MSQLSSLAAAAALSILCVPAFAADNSPAAATEPPPSAESPRQSRVDHDDKQFLDYAALDNQAEIQLCLIAEKQAQSLPVKAFARLMVDDHIQIESRLAALIDDLGVTVPNGVGEDGEGTMARLRDLRGPEFDDAFVKAQIADHAKDVDKFTNVIGAAKGDDVRAFAAETVAILEQHLQLAKAVEAWSESSEGRSASTQK